MHLWLPPNVATAPQTQRTRIGAYLPLCAITGNSVEVADLVNRLAQFRRSDVIRWVCLVSGWVEVQSGYTVPHQDQLAKWLLSPRLREGVTVFRRQREGGEDVLFHWRALWLILQLAVMACRDEGAETPDQELILVFGECCLMANDVLQRVEPTTSFGVFDGTESNDWAVSFAVHFLHGGDRDEILARAQSFWFDLPTSPNILRKLSEMGVKDFSATFEERYHVPLREFFLILVSLHRTFTPNIDTDTAPSPVRLDGEVFRGLFAEEHFRRAMEILSQSPDELATRQLREARQNWSLDATPLQNAPLLRIRPSGFVCPNLQILYRFLTDGIYHLLREAYPADKFGQLFGYVFEEYVRTIFHQFAPEVTQLARSFYSSPKFTGTKDQAADGVYYRDDTAVLMEFKARVLTTRERHGGLRDVTRQGINSILSQRTRGNTKGVGQLAGNLARILRGERLTTGTNIELDLSGCRQLIPMLVTYEDMVAFNAVRQDLDDDLREALRKGQADPSCVEPLLIFGVHDIEVLEMVALRHDVRRVILDFADYVVANPGDRLAKFDTYAAGHGLLDQTSSTRPWVSQVSSRVYAEVLSELQRRAHHD